MATSRKATAVDYYTHPVLCVDEGPFVGMCVAQLQGFFCLDLLQRLCKNFPR
ncbi:MAG: hypothetical protein MJZ41_06480 [Bacteroidaceae bacterium]|nr:hypothetical protein [Bacteroidaceae bacterium]